jgi:hypothetical protein
MTNSPLPRAQKTAFSKLLDIVDLHEKLTGFATTACILGCALAFHKLSPQKDAQGIICIIAGIFLVQILPVIRLKNMAHRRL